MSLYPSSLNNVSVILVVFGIFLAKKRYLNVSFKGAAMISLEVPKCASRK
jgi:hypothetical protein